MSLLKYFPVLLYPSSPCVRFVYLRFTFPQVGRGRPRQRLLGRVQDITQCEPGRESRRAQGEVGQSETEENEMCKAMEDQVYLGTLLSAAPSSDPDETKRALDDWLVLDEWSVIERTEIV